MPFENCHTLLKDLLAAKSTDAVRRILEGIGDYANIELDEPFGPFSFRWHAFGDNLSNISSIGLATKTGRSLTERLTNAMDAILEDRAPSRLPLPRSARGAAQQWFGRPISGPEDGLFNWPFSENGYDRRIAIVINSSGERSVPTIDILDDGIGLSPQEFPKTILSLQSGNKITKWYLIGAFGQGGASTLAFCDYALIISRHKENPRTAAFTVIRVLTLSEKYKEDCYAYLSIKESSGQITVPSCQLDDGPLSIYQPYQGIRLPTLYKGTLVRHISYKLTKLDGSLAPSPGNLYHFLHCSAFDPLIPFRLIDLREPDKARDELVTGSRNRLMKLSRSRVTDAEGEESGSEIKHHRPMEYVVPQGDNVPSIGVEYWVVFNYRKGRGSQRDQLILRPQSNELFVQTGHPIIGTLNGQNQGELTAQLLRDLGLGMVARHMIIHLDATQADSRIRRELFATSREGFKDGPVLFSLVQVLEKMLREDEKLFEIERELTERLAKRESQTASEEVKRQVARLLRDAGFEVQEQGPTVAPGEGEKQPVQHIRRGRHRILDPLPTLPFPEVTRFEIVVPRPKMEIRLNDNEVVLVETDADSEFDRRGLVHIRTEPDHLELAARSLLRGGRLRWRLRPRQIAKVGDIGRIVATITKPDGTQLSDAVPFEVLPSKEEKAKKVKGFVPPFEIIPINPEHNAEQWEMVWPNLDETVPLDDQASVAYRPLRVGDGINVYYSTIFKSFKEQVEKLKNESPALLELFQTNYEIWIAYHAILQENLRLDMKEEIDDELKERILEADRNCVARMQAKQAMRMAELIHNTMREQKIE